MRKIYALIICITLVQMTFGQISTNYNAKWFFGVNTGTTWQTTDVQNKNNWGWGLTLGKSFHYNTGTLVSFDIRGRFLHGFWYGQDRHSSDFTVPNTTLSQGATNYKDTLGFAVHNFQTENYNFNLELVMHANRLRERTRWDAYIFGGIGLNWNQTYGDYLNTDPTTGEQSLYNWDVNSLSRSYLKNTQDGVYETALDGSQQNSYSFNASSSLGFGLGYQVGKAVTIGLEHLTTFTNYDQFDGFSKDSKYKQDLYHYTSAYIQFRLFGHNRDNYEPTPSPTTTSTSTNQNMPPVVTYTQPRTSGTEVSNPNYIIQANITNVFDKENVTFTQNGVYNGSFLYNVNSDLFSCNVVLQPGQNLFELTGSNQYGTDTKTMIVIYKREVETPPVVSYQQPGTNPLTVNNANFNVIGRVLNVKTKDQVAVKFNGQPVTNFSLNTSNGQVDFPVVLNLGSNNVEIKGTNTAGTDTKITTIIYQQIQTIQPPVVYYTDPVSTPTTVGAANFTIRGKIVNVDNNANVIFKQNGTSRTNFSFNPATDEFVCTVVLSPGQNIFELYGTNAAGTASASTVINYERQIATKNPPIVSISNPNSSPASVNNANFQFSGIVLNVTAKSQVSFLVNGTVNNGFTFNTNNGSVLASLTLNPGANTIYLKGTNADGMDSKEVTVVYTPVQTVQAPVVTYANPSNNPLNVTVNSYAVQATVTNVSTPSGINIVCNGQNVNVFTYNNGLLNFNLNLVQGANVLTVTGTNMAGSDSKTTTIFYQPISTVIPPVVNFVNPSSNPLNVSVANYSVQANVLNVASKNDITVKINGVATSNFTYSSTSKMVNFTTALVYGANSMEVKGTNTAGSDTKTTTIVYREPAPQTPPTVHIVQPVSSPLTVNNAPYTVLADVTEISNANEVSVKVNGTAISGYSVNIAQQKVTIPATLVEGANVFLITVTTTTGTASDSKTIIYQKPVVVLPPAITYTSPSTPGTTVDYNQFAMSAKVLRVDAKQQIVVKKDGQIVNTSGYSYTNSTNQLSFPLTLSVGNNLFEITATNDGGSVSSSTNIVYVPKEIPCDKPIITPVKPTNSGEIVAAANYNFEFNISGISGSQNVQFLFNGNQVVGNSTGGGNFAIPVVLNNGNNILQVSASNSCGTTTANASVEYRRKEIPCFTPVIVPILPTEQNSSTNNPGAMIQLSFANILAANQIVLKVNNQIASFNFDAAQKLLTTEVNLAVGLNTITVIATNPCGSVNYTFNITRIACAKPSISLIYANVANNQSTFATDLNMTLSLTEIDNNNQIQVLLNNKPIAFNYSASTNILEVNYTINPGIAQFKVIVTNNCGTAQYLHTVTRQKSPTRSAPTVGFTNPASSPINVNSGVYTVQFATSQIIDAAELILKVNGQPVNFSFDRLSNSGSATINLQSGSNTVTITAVNPVGTANATATIIYAAARGTSLTPTIQFVSPNSSPSTIQLGINKIKGTVENVNSTNAVSIKVNGVAVNRVSKRMENGKILFEFDLNAVVNKPIYQVEVIATNNGKIEIATLELRLNATQIQQRIERPNATPPPVRGGTPNTRGRR
jgi:large repetitive protein